MRTLSASSLSDFASCPRRFYLKHVKRLDLIERPESLRIGTHWHKLMEFKTNQEIVDYLNAAYCSRPAFVDPDEWEIEREILLNSYSAWAWYWRDDPIEVIAREVRFEIHGDGLHEKGFIDRLVRRNSEILIGEYKSTGMSVASDSDFWDGLRTDLQISIYLAAINLAMRAGHLEQYGIPADTNRIHGCLYDVWHKPGIRPKKIKGELETPAQFGERLFGDIVTRPEFYFARQEIVRTEKELVAAQDNLRMMSGAISAADDENLWWYNWHSCKQYGRCPFYKVCLYNEDVEDSIPEGFRRKENYVATTQIASKTISTANEDRNTGIPADAVYGRSLDRCF